MTLLTHAHLLDRYGPLLTESQLGEVLHLAPGTLRNQRRTRATACGVDMAAQSTTRHGRCKKRAARFVRTVP